MSEAKTKSVTGYSVSVSLFMPFDPADPKAVADAAAWANSFNNTDEGRVVVEKYSAKIVTHRDKKEEKASS